MELDITPMIARSTCATKRTATRSKDTSKESGWIPGVDLARVTIRAAAGNAVRTVALPSIGHCNDPYHGVGAVA